MNSYYHLDLQLGLNSLSAEESLHCARSHRAQVGESVMLVNGMGGRGVGRIASISRSGVVVEVEDLVQEAQQACERNWIGIAPTKHMDRMEWFVEKAVEVGVGRISFFYSQYSERRELRQDRLWRIVVEAGKQCQASWFPSLEGPMSFVELLADARISAYSRAIAHYPSTGLIPLESFMQVAEKMPKLLLVGPEGGFSGDEYAQAIDSGYLGVSLGTRRLRTETAALTGCVVLAHADARKDIYATN